MIPNRFLSVAVLLALAGCTPTPKPMISASVPMAAAKPAPKPAPKPAWQARKVVPDAVTVPGGRLHTVKPGETGIAIARAYGVDWGTVVSANALRAPYTLEVGQKLLLPSAKAAADRLAAMSIEQRAAAFSVNIDDLITGSEPAAPKPGASQSGASRPAKPAVPPLATGANTATASAAPPLAPLAPLPDLGIGAPQFQWPIDGRILSGFGAKPGGRYNDGVNLKATAGSAVRAAADGVVAYAGDAIPGFGNLLLIKHAGGWVTAYGHNEALLVTRGTRVRGGEVIARAGATGSVDSAQLHFEVRRGRTAVDPQRMLPPRG